MVKGSLVFKTFDTRQEASEWVNEVRFRRDKGRQVITKPVTIEQMFQAYLEYIDEKDLSTGTLKSSKSRFYKHILPGYGKDLDMTSVTKEEHRTFARMLKNKNDGKGRKLSSASRNRCVSLVRRMYSLAIKYELFEGAFQVNPFDSFEESKESQKSIEYFNKQELNQFLTANRNSHYYPLFLFLFRTGLRIGEACAVQGEKIDLSNQMLTVDCQFSSAENKIIPNTKSGNIRMIYLVDEVIEALKPLKLGLLFNTDRGTKLTPNYFLKFVFPKACDKAEVKRINPHATRHTFASHFLMDGGSLWDLSKILGHADTKTTEQRYGHFDIPHIKRRMRLVGRQDNVIRIDVG